MTTQNVPGWYAVIPSGSAKSFAPIAIASVEAFGVPTVLKEQRIAAIEIISSELFGAATLNPGTVQVTSAGGISSEEHVGFPVVYAAGGAVSFIIVSGMDSLETFGNTTINAGPVNIAPAGIASAETFGTQTIAAGATEIRPISIDGVEEFGATVVMPGSVNVASPGIASAEVFGAATITSRATVIPTGIASAEAFGSATITSRVTATGIASAEAFGTAAITRGAVVVLPSGIASAEAFGTAIVAATFTPFTETNTARTNQPLPTAAAFKGTWVTLIGAGGGGGSGRRASSGVAGGGSGGGGGAYIPRIWVPKANLGSTYSVTVPSVAATGGVGQATANTNGNPGSAGTATVFASGATTLTAGGGGGGPGGIAGTAGVAAGGTPTSGVGGAAGTAGGAGGAAGAVGIDGPTTNSGGAGGGGGSGFDGIFQGVGGKGGNANGQIGGAGGAVDVAGTPGSALVAGIAGSGGGGGGSTSTAVAGKAGGNAPGYGGGGGGGGYTSGSPTGNGGSGGPGYSLIDFLDAIPILFDAVGAGGAAGGTSVNWTQVITGNCVVVPVSYWGNTATPTVTAQVGSTNMTLLGAKQNYVNASGNFGTVLLFGLLTPPTGSQTITVTALGSVSLVADSASYFNVISFGTAVTNNGTGTAMSLSVTATATQMVAQAFAGFTSGFSAYNKTSRYAKPYAFGVNLDFQMGDAYGPSPAFTATIGAAEGWGAIGVPLLN